MSTGGRGATSPAEVCCWLGNILIRNLPSFLRVHCSSIWKNEDEEGQKEGGWPVNYRRPVLINCISVFSSQFWVLYTLIKCSLPMCRCSRFFWGGDKNNESRFWTDKSTSQRTLLCYIFISRSCGRFFFPDQLAVMAWSDRPISWTTKEQKNEKSLM